ncbi:K+-transporting ATPase ATPase A chain [Luteibacter rhizovicinus]|uniref:Potassium-transporting ATPase potassium-binding subunit n=1 Tax=Luteibacter rhizovicinus TaxID=242606 RepID=A0A4R3YNG2_9GAMM|nr:potassium-transporting ATPase subunit KdpA [Luteibacter rhizovicinus]TCV93861.1 K+-transporting ATPase ATPase A chain [Luteibacter rhizovicinus]
MEILIAFGLAILLAWPLGRYMAVVMQGRASRLDIVFAPVERLIYRWLRVDPARGMDWRSYAAAFLGSNVALFVLAFTVFMTQAWLPLNPDGVPNMSWHTALHTTMSFLTNTDQQHYSGQAQLSYLAQMTGIVTLQMLSPVMGLAALVAVLRGIVGGLNVAQAREGEPRDLGNYWADMTRATLRILLPLCLVLSLALTWQGVPATFGGAHHAVPVDSAAGMASQTIPVGPVSPMVAIKQLGTNGGGWYGPNSAVPLENPTPLSNLLEVVSIPLLPMACIFMAGAFVGRRRFTALIFAVMGTLCIALTTLAVTSEQHPNAAAHGIVADAPNMEGKEQRLGPVDSALWAALTTQVNNGSVNAMHDSMNPGTGLATMSAMLINMVWGGIGCGLLGFLIYMWITAFVCGLMTGRTPEVFGRKLETREIKLLSALLVLQPIVLLGLTAIALSVPSITGNSNPAFHGLSQVFYEYTSAYANNGSGFAGLSSGTVWWDMSCFVVLALGRFPAILIPLAVAGSLAAKRAAPAGNGTLRVETPTFGFAMLAVIVLFALLSFMPVLVLGPIGEWLSLAAPSIR